MTIEELKEAHKNGAKIQFRLDGKGWTDWENPKFDCQPSEYRIKPKYRPFKDCDELIATLAKKIGYKAKANTMPLIWVRSNDGTTVCISSFGGKHTVGLSWFNTEAKDIREMFNNFTFLDGSPFGVCE